MSESAQTVTVQGQPSWRVASSLVEAFVTEQGGHLAPVTFDRAGRGIQPFHVAPWAEENLPEEPIPLLRALRGDFFCMPFGGNDTPFRGEKHPVHGETAGEKWSLLSLSKDGTRTALRLAMDVRTRPARVEKTVAVVDGHNAVYCRHVVSGMSGPMNLGHHATLRFPDVQGCGRLSTSGIRLGMVFPEPTEKPENRGYSILKPGARFDDPRRVPTITGETADLTRYPARRGFEDIAILISEPRAPFCWTAVTFPEQRFAWFALKDAAVLPATLLWMSNGGRHYPPWNGRHVNVMGLEEIRSCFHYGLAESAGDNVLTRLGVPTCFEMRPDRALAVSYIMAAVPVPDGFDEVKSIEPGAKEATLALTSASGVTVKVPVDWKLAS